MEKDGVGGPPGAGGRRPPGAEAGRGRAAPEPGVHPIAKPGRSLALATFTLLTLIWGTTWAVIRVGLRGIPPFTGVALRFTIASLALLLVGLVTHVPLGRTPRERWLWLVNAALTFSTSYGVVYWSEQW
ncbi:MAG TPA: DMT family transporter, partial [Candidatus Polarisedimenticolia bacterium]|nr:DMT family transporter [Candidatus Polarisedimenticolia bacterium]